MIEKLISFTAVWGNYIDAFVNVILPSIRDELNKIQIHHNINYIIVTTEDTIDRIKDVLSDVNFKYQFIIIDYPDQDPQVIIDKWFHIMIERCFHLKAWFVPLAPDVIYFGRGLSHQFLKTLKLKKKAMAVPVGGLRAYTDKFLSATSEEWKEPEKWFIQCMHAETQAHFITSDNFHPFPAMLLEQKENFIKVNSLISQPLFTKIISNHAIEFKQIETDFLGRAIDDFEDIHFARTSRELFPVSLTGEINGWPPDIYDYDRVEGYFKSKEVRFSRQIFNVGYKIIT